MSKIVLDNVEGGFNLQKINSNFQKIEDELNSKVLYRDNPAGEPNSMSKPLDMDGNDLLNVATLSVTESLSIGGIDLGTEVARAQTYANEALASAQSANIDADSASSSASSAASSAATATTQAGIATTQAGIATTKAAEAVVSASNAATSASSASTSASTATTQAGIATTQAGIATSAASSATASASSATTSASNASSSASSAASSAAAAALALDNFDDRYLGSKTTAPTLDNDGNALVAGALYFNDGTVVSEDKGMYVYDGATWIAASAASQAILIDYEYTATAGQTVFTGVAENSLTLEYTPGSILVTLNGVVLDGEDFTATNGTSVVLTVGASAGNELRVLAFSTFDIANTYTQAQADALLAAKQPLSSNLTAYAANNPSFRNRIINGAMVIDQRNNGAAVSMTSVVYPTDRWLAFEDTDGTMTAQRSTVAPAGFTNSILITTTLADTSLAAAQYARLCQRIEGFNVADFGWGTASASTVTLSFWVRSSLTGTFGGAFTNNAFNRSYPFTYTISVANTWEQKFITVAGDTSGTWLTDNGTGVEIDFGLGVGSTYSGTAGAWAGAGYLTATGAVSVVGTSGATFYITGVQLEKGATATSFDYRDYVRETALCQRYYEKSYDDGVAPGTATLSSVLRFPFGASASGVFANAKFKVPKRASPTVRTWDEAGNSGRMSFYTASGFALTNNLNALASNWGGNNEWGFSASTTTAGAAGTYTVQWDASAEL